MTCAGRRDSLASAQARARAVASDAQLLGAVANGDEHAFALLHRRFERRALAIALRVCQERMLAEEAVQEAFIAVWRRASLFDGRRGQAHSWVAAIVRNEAIDALARRGAATSADEEEIASIAERWQDGEDARAEHQDALRAALLALPGEQSSVIELVFFGGYSLVEVASLLSTPLGTVKSRMRLGIAKLRAQIEAGALDACGGRSPPL
ncbi:MAG: RNA polymerase sigma factor [Solirubrobacteraceae bacterium]